MDNLYRIKQEINDDEEVGIKDHRIIIRFNNLNLNIVLYLINKESFNYKNNNLIEV